VFRKRQLDAKKREETLSRIILQIPDAREYISVKEAVAIFGVERDTIYRLIRKGRIPAINLGTRLTRIKREDLEKLIPTRDTIKAEKTEEIGNSVYPPARRKLAEHGIGCSGTVGQIGERLRLSENKAIQDYSV
jgi:excisionase family DNA binding protein